jgi:ribosomal-protein-alanine N-acetyltransferase
MKRPGTHNPGDASAETGAYRGGFQVAPVSSLWLPRLVEIDSTWNPKSWSLKLFERELENPAARLRGIFAGEYLIGYLAAHVVLDEAHIVSLGIDPEWRGKGAGRAILMDFLRIAGLENITVVTLEVRASNVIAQKLYERAGFKAAGIRRHYYSNDGEDAITMRYESDRKG